MTLILRNVRPWGGAPADLVVAGGVIAAVGGEVARGSDEIDGRGAVVLPGLHDHHLHLLALAARRESVDLSALLDPVAITARLRASPAPFIRAVAYDERAVGLPDAAVRESRDRVRAAIKNSGYTIPPTFITASRRASMAAPETQSTPRGLS